MAQKKITELQLISAIADGVNIPGDDSIQTYRLTVAQLKAFILQMTTGGDMIYGGASGAPTRLPNGSAGQALKSGGGTAAPAWAWGVFGARQSKTTTYTVLATDGHIDCDTSGGAWTLTLPAAGSMAGKCIEIKKTSNDTALLTIDANASETIDDVAAIYLQVRYEGVTIRSNGTNWVIISQVLTTGLNSTAGLAAKANNSNWEDCTSLSLCPGEWILSGQLMVNAISTVTAGDMMIGISTTSGNSATGLTAGTTLMQQNTNTASGTSTSVYITGMRVAVTSTTTYYLKMKKDNGPGGATLNFAYNLTAQRVKI